MRVTKILFEKISVLYLHSVKIKLNSKEVKTNEYTPSKVIIF